MKSSAQGRLALAMAAFISILTEALTACRREWRRA